jgi:hypothetical protein
MASAPNTRQPKRLAIQALNRPSPQPTPRTRPAIGGQANRGLGIPAREDAQERQLADQVGLGIEPAVVVMTGMGMTPPAGPELLIEHAMALVA